MPQVQVVYRDTLWPKKKEKLGEKIAYRQTDDKLAAGSLSG